MHICLLVTSLIFFYCTVVINVKLLKYAVGKHVLALLGFTFTKKSTSKEKKRQAIGPLWSRVLCCRAFQSTGSSWDVELLQFFRQTHIFLGAEWEVAYRLHKLSSCHSLSCEWVNHLTNFVDYLSKFMLHMFGSWLRQSFEKDDISHCALLQSIMCKVRLPLVVVLYK